MDIKLISQFAFYGGLVFAVGSFIAIATGTYLPIPMIGNQYGEITSVINKFACMVFGFSSAFLGAFGLYVTRGTTPDS